jgi:hypothetical protein
VGDGGASFQRTPEQPLHLTSLRHSLRSCCTIAKFAAAGGTSYPRSRILAIAGELGHLPFTSCNKHNYSFATHRPHTHASYIVAKFAATTAVIVSLNDLLDTGFIDAKVAGSCDC